MKKIFVLLSVIFFIGITYSSCYAENANDAIRALKKLETRTEVGVSYRDYPAVLSDAKFTVKMYLKEKIPIEDKKKASDIALALEYYEKALYFWSFIDTYKGSCLPIDSIAGKEFMPKLSAVFPEAVKPITEGGLIAVEDANMGGGEIVTFKNICFSSIAAYCWGKASEILKNY